MILRLSTSFSRGLFLLLALMLAARFTYSGVRNAMAQHNAGLNTRKGLERATQWEPDDARNWYLLGRYWQYNMEEPDVQRAISAYQKSLSLDSHSAGTWSDLATAYESEGNLTASRNAFRQAKFAYPLSPDVSWRFGNFLVRKGEFDAAYLEIRDAVRIDPKRGAAAFALCMRINPEIETVVDRVLPPSSAAYLSVLASLIDQRKSAQALVIWSRLLELKQRFPLQESYGLIELLIQEQRLAEARDVWQQALAEAGVARPPDPPASLIWDGGFESNTPSGGFTWRNLSGLPGVQTAFDTNVKHSGSRSLRLTFEGLQNVDLHDICQIVAVAPSTSYDFSAWLRTDALSTDQGIRFGFHSLGSANSPVGWTEDVRGTQPWSELHFTWTSGKDVHGLQLCITRIPSTKFDNKIHGTVWIDDVTLVPKSSERPVP